MKLMKGNFKNVSRKKMLIWGATLFSSISFFKFSSIGKPTPKGAVEETVTMLTEDGKLVNIDKKLMVSTREKISNEELKNWIKK